MNGGLSIIRRSGTEKSNTELINSLRSNIDTARQGAILNPDSTAAAGEPSSTDVNPSAWTSHDADSIQIPSIDFSSGGLGEERSGYDITVKLFFLPSTRLNARAEHVKEAVNLVLRELRVPSIDVLIVSFAGISFDADDDEDEDLDDSDGSQAEQMDDIVGTWQSLESLHAAGIVSQIGLAEFGSERLRKLLPRVKVRPSVDQINVRDCCVVPKSLILYAKEEKIQLLTHNDCTNILPKGTVRELLGPSEKGAGLLADPKSESKGLRGEVEPQWVTKYTAVVRDRGVIENKGYFAMAELSNST
ncbi:hypothetical protein MMC25_002476 [Agyrium rufum]|nr:hypothetical protein [Agyrium rufum]